MYKKILFGTCLTEYCDHIFNFSLNLAKQNNAKLWIYYGLGRMNGSEEMVTKAIKAAETKVAQTYIDRMEKAGFNDYLINVSEGDVVSEVSKLARNAGIDLMVMGTSTEVPIQMGESIVYRPLGPVVAETVLWAPCPVMIIPPALIPGLASG